MSSMYPRATDIESEEIEGGYEVSFKMDDVEYEALIDVDGNWVETVIEIPVNDLPGNVAMASKNQYPGYSIVEVDEVLSAAHGQIYELALSSESGKDIEVMFDVNGELVRVETIAPANGDIDAQEYDGDDDDDEVIE